MKEVLEYIKRKYGNLSQDELALMLTGAGLLAVMEQMGDENV